MRISIGLGATFDATDESAMRENLDRVLIPVLQNFL